MAEKRTRPRDLERRGRRLWSRITSEFDLADTELELLEEACRVVDRIDELRAQVTADGRMVPGSKDQLVLHPGIAEERQQRELLGRLLRGLALPAEEQAETAAATLGRRGAAARWYGRPRPIEKGA